MRKEGFRELVSLASALKIIDEIIIPIGDEKIRLEDALGRVLAKDIISPISVPHFRKAAMDGFAVIASNTFGASDTNPQKLIVIDSIRASMMSKKRVQPGECMEIATGAPVPEGSNAVLMVEYTEKRDNKMLFYKSIAPGENIIEVGSDIKKGTKVFSRGARLNSRYTGVLAALGIVSVLVKKKPVVGVLSTGAEIISADEPLIDGKIYDINSRTLIDALREQNCEVIGLGIARDDKEELRTKILEGIRKTDFLVVSGGSSLGAEDLMKEVVSELGELLVHGIAVKPGKPTVIAKIEGKLMLGLPGYPTSALSNFYILALPILDKMLGTHTEEQIISAKLTRKVVSTIGRYEFLPVKLVQSPENQDEGTEINGAKGWGMQTGPRLSGRGLQKYVTPILKGSSAITTLANADGFVEIAENTEVIGKGETVKVKLF